MIKFELVTLDGTKFGDLVHEVMLPTPDGHVAIFEHHSPLVSLATPGIITIRRKESDPDERLEFFATNGGVVEIVDNTVRLLADEADHAEEINEQEAKKAYDDAQNLLRQAKDQVSLDHAQTLIDRSAVRLKVAGLRRRARHR